MKKFWRSLQLENSNTWNLVNFVQAKSKESEDMKNYMDHIEINPKKMFGKPTIKGTRITVELILEELAAGKNANDLLNAHPNLKKEDIWAALAFAADSLKGERVYPVAV